METRLVIIPGWTGTIESWSSCVALLRSSTVAEDIRVIELPCFGNEPCPQAVWGTNEYAAFFAAKLNTLPPCSGNTIIIGHSFGGAVAVNAIDRGLIRPDALILAGAAIVRPSNIVRRSVGKLLAIGKRLLTPLPLLGPFLTHHETRVKHALGAHDAARATGIEKQIHARVVREDQQSRLSSIDMPTLLLWGNMDTMTPLWQGKKIYKQLLHGTMVVVEDGAHGLHHTHPAMFVQAVKQVQSQL